MTEASTTEYNAVMQVDDAYKTAWIHTRHGKFDLDNPTFDVRDIAHSLAQIARFNGHCREFYNVATHSIIVAYIMDEYVGGDPLEGLLHDATEAYLSDVPAPFKHVLPDWKAVDARVELAMRKHFRLPLAKTAYCQEADWLALFIEAKQLVLGEGADFADPHGLRDKALRLLDKDSTFEIEPGMLASDPHEDKYEWLECYTAFNEQRRAREA